MISYTRSLRAFDLRMDHWLHHALEYMLRIQIVIVNVASEVWASLYVYESNICTSGTSSEGHLNSAMSAESLLGP